MSKHKVPFVLALIGVILGFFSSLVVLFQYFLYKSIADEAFNEFINSSGIFGGLLIWSLISSVIGLVLSLVLVFYVVRLSKNPSKSDYIVIIVLGSLGIFLGMGIGGILVLISGIVGLVKS